MSRRFRFPNHYMKYLFCFMFVTFALTGCQSEETNDTKAPVATSEPLRETQFMMGTSITITLHDNQDQAILDKAFAKVEELEDTLSLNQSNTLLDTVNQNAGVEPTVVTEDMFNVVERGLYYSELTDGSFDITVGPLVKLWNIGFPDARVPSQEEIDSTIPLVDYTRLSLDSDAKTIYMDTPGMKLDLGSIAKGYAADQVISILKESGVNHALVDLGGNLFVLGTKTDGSSWRVGVQDPFNPRGQIIGIMELTDKSVVTSGIYERYLEVEDTKYHHILDPQTGYPFDNEIAGVTIISDTSIDGDALSTSIFSKGIEEGLEFVDTLDGIEAVFVSKDKEVYMTDGIKDNFTLNNADFTIVD